MKTGRRVWDCELSTIDTGFLIAGMLTAATYFDRDNPVEAADPRDRRRPLPAGRLGWATNGGAAITHGWRPETGFIPYRYEGYDEGLLLYVLALGSPTYPLGPESYAAWSSTFQWKADLRLEYLYSGPLFTHQLSHLFIDFRGIQDAFMRDRGIDYFENSRRATYVQREYAIRNPLEFAMYGEVCWGFTACDGPGWTTGPSTGSSGSSSTTSPAGPRSGPTTGRSRRGWWSPRCRSPPRSSCRRSRTSTASTSG